MRCRCSPPPRLSRDGGIPRYATAARDREQHQGVEIRGLPLATYCTGGSLRSRLHTTASFALLAGWRLLSGPRPEVIIAVCPSTLAVLALRPAFSRRVRPLAVVQVLQSGLATWCGNTSRMETFSPENTLQRIIR